VRVIANVRSHRDNRPGRLFGPDWWLAHLGCVDSDLCAVRYLLMRGLLRHSGQTWIDSP
jgi:hypothetical protein